MFATSHDVLNIALAVSVVAVAFFLSWGLLYVTLLIRQVYHAIRDTGEIIGNLKDASRMIKEKIEFGAASISLVAEGLKKVVELVKDKDKKKEGAKRSKKDR